MGPIKLRIMSANIRVDVKEDRDTGDNWEAREEFCAKVMASNAPDVIGIQEAQNRHFHDLQARLLKYDTYGMATLNPVYTPSNFIMYDRSRFELISAGGFWLSETPHIEGSKSWDCANPRFANYVLLRDYESRKSFRFWNVHFDHIGQTARRMQAQMMVEASQVFKDDLPQFLTGDFNSDMKHPAIGILKDGGWVDTYAAAHGPEDPGFTFHAFLGPKYAESRPANKIPGKIDFIFSRGPVESHDSYIIKDHKYGHYPSDHYFLVADVTFT